LPHAANHRNGCTHCPPILAVQRVASALMPRLVGSHNSRRAGSFPAWFLKPGTILNGLMSSCCCKDRHAEVDRSDAGQPLGLLPFLSEEGEGEVDALDLTKPSFVLGAGAAGPAGRSRSRRAGGMGQRKHASLNLKIVDLVVDVWRRFATVGYGQG